MSKLDPWCINPFIGIYIDTKGRYKLCCVSKPIENMTLENNSIEEIFSSDIMNKIRKDMLYNKKSDLISHYCTSCIEEDATTGVDSQRIHDNKQYKFKNRSKTSVKFFEKNQTNYDILNIQFMDINLVGNLCNYKCIMCTPFCSSRLAAENAMHSKTIEKSPSLILPFSSEKNKNNFLDSLSDTLHNIEKIYFRGGEVFIDPDFERVLKVFSELTNAKNMHIHITTNCSVIPNYIFNYKRSFKQLTISVSIDGIGDKIEYIRFGSSWKKIDENIDKLLKNDMQIQFNIAVQMLNVGYIDEIYNYMLAKKINPKLTYLIHVQIPQYFDCVYLPETIKSKYLHKLKKDTNSKYYKDKIFKLLDYTPSDNPFFDQGIKKLKYYDVVRKNSLLKNFPEFKEYYPQ